MSRERLVWADALKGWLIILVVLGHALQHVLGLKCDNNHLWNVIYSFHMPAFMAVSGYLAYRVGGAKPLFQTLWRRFRQLMIPFILWTILLLLNKGCLTLESVGDYLLFPDKGLWFLWVLFFIAVVFALGNWAADRLHVRQKLVVAALCLMFAGTMVVFEIRILGYQFIAYYFIIYSLGYYLHKYYDVIVSSRWIVVIPLFVLWSFLAWNWQMHNLPSFLQSLPLPQTLVQYVYRFVTATLAIYILFAISPKLLNRSDKWNAPFVNMGVLSLGVYTAHFIFLGRLVEMINRVGLKDIWAVVVSFVAGLLLSWLLAWLLSKWKISATWLLGKI